MLLEKKTACSSVERDVIESTEPDVEEAARNRDAFPSTGGYGGVTVEGFSPLGRPTPQPSNRDPEVALQKYIQSHDASNGQTKDVSETSPIFPDVIDRGILNMEKATEMVRKYKDDLLPLYDFQG